MCTDPRIAATYFKAAVPYTRYKSVQGTPGPYDPESIMHYNSELSTSDPRCYDMSLKGKYCPLARWVDPNDHTKGIAFIKHLKVLPRPMSNGSSGNILGRARIMRLLLPLERSAQRCCCWHGVVWCDGLVKSRVQTCFMGSSAQTHFCIYSVSFGIDL